MEYHSAVSQQWLGGLLNGVTGSSVNPAKQPQHEPIILQRGQRLHSLPGFDSDVETVPVSHKGSETIAADLDRLLTIQKWARLLDARFTIPGTNIRYGWDSIIGLVPWAGDLLTGLVGAWLVYLAYRAGVPQMLLLQMVMNIVLDFAAGSIPVVGDLFDLAFKAHIRNAILMENYVKDQQAKH